MVKSIVLILLLFNGDIVLKELKFDGNMVECGAYADKLRVELTHFNEEKNIHFLKNNKGTWQGYFCKDNYEGGIIIRKKTQ